MKNQIRKFLLVMMGAAYCFLGGLQSFAEPDGTQLRFDIVGIRLQVDPPELVVPKNIATQINAVLATPEEASGQFDEAINALSEGALIRAELRGPSFPTRQITVRPGQPIPLPPFVLPGDYILDQIRLEKNGEVVMNGTPNSVPIQVISEILVSSVTSRPLELDEIREKGIVIDESNFTAVNFSFGLAFEETFFQIELPAVIPEFKKLAFEEEPELLIQKLASINQKLRETTPVQLPPELERPGLNFSIAAIPFFPAGAIEEEGPLFNLPPLAGIQIIGHRKFIFCLISIFFGLNSIIKYFLFTRECAREE